MRPETIVALSLLAYWLIGVVAFIIQESEYCTIRVKDLPMIMVTAPLWPLMILMYIGESEWWERFKETVLVKQRRSFRE